MTSTLSPAPAAAAQPGPAPPSSVPAGGGPRPLRRRVEALLLSLAGCAVLLLATRYPVAGPLVAPGWILMLLPAAGARWRAPLTGYLPGLMLFAIAGHWAMRHWGWFVPLLLPPLLMVTWAAQAVLAAGLRRFTRWPAWAVLALAVPAGEWLRAPLSVGSFNAYQAGPFLFGWPVLVQAAEYVGATGLSLLSALPWAVVAAAVIARMPGAAGARPGRAAWSLAGAALVVLVGLGALRLATVRWDEGPRVAVIQPSLDHQGANALDLVQRQAQQTAAAVPPGSADLVAWPENAVLGRYAERPDLQDGVRWTAMRTGAPLLFGAEGLAPDGVRPTNSAFVVLPGGTVAGRYDKVVLFPFTERRVLRGLQQRWPAFADALARLTRSAWDVAPDGWSAPGPGVLRVPGVAAPFWTAICYESAYPELGRAARRGGARFFLNLTSEGWIGWGASNNMMAVNVLRAVENRVGLVRAGNTGPSAFVDPAGRVEAYLRGARTGRLRLEAGTLTRRIAVGPEAPTLYARFGGLLDPLPFAAVAAALALGMARAFAARRRAESALPGSAA